MDAVLCLALKELAGVGQLDHSKETEIDLTGTEW